MNLDLKRILAIGAILIGLSFGIYKVAFSSACCSSTAATSGCTPSNCRGAKTKFGEAKVIGDLRLSLIDLKADMEQSKSPSFNQRTFDIHNIIGQTDDESLEIMAKEVKVIEKAFVEKLNHDPSNFDLPSNKAQQVEYLNTRIQELKTLL